MGRRQIVFLHLLLALALLANIGLWLQSRHLQARWMNVPPTPGEDSVKGFGLGDPQLGYRSIGIMLQNLGDTGGRVTALKDYDYPALGRWFMLADKLDPRSRFMPVLAALYFGASQNPAELPPVIDYLSMVGRRAGPEGFQWLMQALYLARFRMHDMPRALLVAQQLAALWQPGMPLWVKQAPAMVMTASGDKREAYGMMLSILNAEAGKVPQAELNSMIVFMCLRTLDPTEAKANPLCHTVPQDWLKPLPPDK